MEVLKKETYLKMIENSIGTKMFNSIIIKEVSNEIRDLLNDGEYSCALFVSSVLFLHKLAPQTRTTVNNLQKDLEENPLFEKVVDFSIVEPGDVLIWETVQYEDGSSNRHVGFALSDKEAISTNYIQKCVIRHPVAKEIENTGEIRKIEQVFRPKY